MSTEKPKPPRPLVIMVNLHVSYGQFWRNVKAPLEQAGFVLCDYDLVRGPSFAEQFQELRTWVTELKTTTTLPIVVACPTFTLGEMDSLNFAHDGTLAWAAFQESMRVLGVGCVRFQAEFSGFDFHFLLLQVREPVAELIVKLKAAVAALEA